MTPEEARSAYLRYRLERAEESLRAARLLADAKMYEEALSRLYYACFYAVNALLYSRGMGASKHSGVQALFNQHFVKTGVVERSCGALFNRLFQLRQRSDYEDLYRADPEEVNALIAQVETFIKVISQLALSDTQGTASQ